MRVNNMLVFFGRAGPALLILIWAIRVAMNFSNVALIVAAVIALVDLVLWIWTAACPLWVDLDSEGVTIRRLFSIQNYAWRDLRVFLMYETTRIRGIENTHCFANFRTSAGKWFKVRVRVKDLDQFESCVPESSQGKSIVSHIGPGPQT